MHSLLLGMATVYTSPRWKCIRVGAHCRHFRHSQRRRPSFLSPVPVVRDAFNLIGGLRAAIHSALSLHTKSKKRRATQWVHSQFVEWRCRAFAGLSRLEHTMALLLDAAHMENELFRLFGVAVVRVRLHIVAGAGVDCEDWDDDDNDAL